jgi:hypothetical protein
MSEIFLSPIGRVVQGSVHKLLQATDNKGNPKTLMSGANAGQPQMELFFALAIEKANPDWPTFHGLLQRVAQMAFPGGEYKAPSFSWKIIDGDGYDETGRANNTKEGFAGHWVVRFKTGYTIQAVKGGAVIDPKTIRTGDYVRVTGTVSGNGGGSGQGPSKPGLYLNPNGVEFFGYGQEIVVGPDVKAAFNSAPAPTYRPAGMSTTPTGGVAPAAPVAAVIPTFLGSPGSPNAPAPATPAPVPGTAGHAFAFPGSAPVPAAPPAPAACPLGAPAGYRMKGQWTYTQLTTNGFTNETLVRDGHMEKVA